MALDEFIDWFQREPRPAGFSKATVNSWRAWLEARKLGSLSIIVRVSAIRKRGGQRSAEGGDRKKRLGLAA